MCARGNSFIPCGHVVGDTNAFPPNRLSRRFHALGADSELWKRQYYSQWVHPRARRLANVQRSDRIEYSPRVSTWLDHGHLAKEGNVTNWKRQYRLRHNWAKGLCRVTEVEFPHSPSPSVLIKLCGGFVFMADAAHGLRVWGAKDPTNCLANVPLSDSQGASTPHPTALAVGQIHEEREIVIGFDNGHFSRYDFDVQAGQLSRRSSHIGFGDGAITAMALSPPYLLMVSQHKILSLYNLQIGSHQTTKAGAAKEPRELASLRADNMIAPMTLSIRVSASFDIVASIVYSFFHIGCGWSLGIQELRFGKDGQQLDSRLASTVDSQYGARPRLLQGRSPSNKRRASTVNEPLDNQDSAAPVAPSILHQQPPTSMSYSHPYLLTSHADNTLTMYLVVSNSDCLFVRGSQRLWGHTSSVSAVQVTNRGKAVSVGSRGDEIRIWELETTVPSLGSRRPLKEESSVQISPDKKPREETGSIRAPGKMRPGISGLEFVPDASTESSHMHECIGFDEERVLLLREKSVGTQLLESYDFT